MKAQNLWRAAEALSATAKASGVSLKECEILLRPRSHGTGAVVDTHWANGETTCQALHALRERYPGRPLVLIWDNVRYHHALLVRRCAQDLGIQLRYLPPYSPDLMPVERLCIGCASNSPRCTVTAMKKNCATALLASKPRPTMTQAWSTAAYVPRRGSIQPEEEKLGFERGRGLAQLRRARATPQWVPGVVDERVARSMQTRQAPTRSRYRRLDWGHREHNKDAHIITCQRHCQV